MLDLESGRLNIKQQMKPQTLNLLQLCMSFTNCLWVSERTHLLPQS